MMNRAQLSQRRSSHFSFRKRQNLGDQVIAAMSGALSRVFHTDRTRTIIVGVNPTTRLLANELQAIGNRVSVVSLKSEAGPDHETMPFVKTVHPVTADEIVLTRAGAQSARGLLAASADDDSNFRLCRTAIDKFRVPVVIARLRLMDCVTTWARVNDTGMSRMSWNDLIQALVPDMSLSPVLSRVARADDREQISEIEVRLPIFVGRTIDDLPLKDCEVVALTRKGVPISTYHDTALEMGDVLTLIGMKATVDKVRESFASL
jgi:Trk K+ transport system NAD-binding subunit